MDGQKGSSNVAIVVAILALAVGIGAYAKAQSATAAATSDSLAKIQSSKVMNVCVAEWGEPFSVKDASTGKYSGADIDAMEAIAKAVGATTSYHDTTFGNMAAAVQSGTCDIGTSLYVTPSRAAAVDFARTIFYGGDTALVRKGETRFKTVADLDKDGIIVATATGESGDIYAKANFTKSKITAIDVEAADQTRFLEEVTSGRADVGIADYNTIANYQKAHSADTQVLFTESPFNLSPDAYPVRHGDTNWRNFVSNTILTMQVNGTWNQIESKHKVVAFHEQMIIK